MAMDVKKGDNVFVSGIGYGQVSRILPNGAGFSVRLGATERQFSTDGRVGGQGERKVFWHNPKIVTPCKNEDLWNAYRELAVLLYDKLFQLFYPGGTPDD